MTTEATATDAGATEALELFDDVPETFPSKFDLRDRLVLVWVTGVHGIRKGEKDDYPYEETITLVVDDGPFGWQAEVMNTDTGSMQPNLVPSVAEEGPQKLANFQWSATGVVSRLSPRREAKTNRPMVGRVNSKPNKQRGRAAPWGIASATPEEKALAAQVAGPLVAQICAEVERKLNGVADVSAFD
jgi:hypothetical protein